MLIRSNTRILFIAILFVFISGCSKTKTPSTMPPSYVKQPEPQTPLVGGKITGLTPEALVTIHIRALSGREASYGTQRGSGDWKAVVHESSGLDYIITAEAEGYIAQPDSYVIHISGMLAYVVINSQVTTEEATHLDFHFVPVK